jgi:hypothetical protein
MPTPPVTILGSSLKKNYHYVVYHGMAQVECSRPVTSSLSLTLSPLLSRRCRRRLFFHESLAALGR